MSYPQPLNGNVSFGLEDTTVPANDVVDFSLVAFLTVPENLIVTNDTVVGQLSLGWDSVSAVDGYYVYRSQSTGTTKDNYTQVGDTSTSSFTDDGLDNNTKYFYRVSAYSGLDETGVSDEVSATTVDVLDAPQNVSISLKTQREITVEWDTVDKADGYRVYRSESTGSDYTQLTETTNTSYRDTSLEDGEKYYYQVSAYTNSGDEKLSNEVSQITVLPSFTYTKPNFDRVNFTLEDNTTPQNSSVNFNTTEKDDLDARINDRGNVTLLWDKSDNSLDGTVTVQRSDDDKKTWSTLDILPYDATSYVDNTVDDGTLYHYRVVRSTDHATQTSSEVAPYKIYYRSSSIGGEGQISSTRDPVTSYRSSTIVGDGYQDTTVDLQDVFPDEQALDVSWNYYFEPRGFGTEWFYEDSDIPREKRDGFGVNFHGELLNEINVWIQYDKTGNGEVDLTSEKQSIGNTRNTPVFDEYEEFSEDGWYQVFIRGLRFEDTVNQVDLGHVNENF